MPNSAALRLGTRGSKLAMAQATGVQARLESAWQGLSVEIVAVRTSGDEGKREVLGAFVREIEFALLDRRIDLALHCLKDLPTQQTDGLEFAAHLERDDARDALISRFGGVEDLPKGAVVGTGSVRRTSQLAAMRRDLVFRPLVGNVDTRLRKLQSGEYDAIVLALAGFNRLGLQKNWTTTYPGFNLIPLSLEQMLPAPGQAVLVLQAREEDSESTERAAVLNCPATRECAIAEREFLGCFGGGCSTPVAAHCAPSGDGFSLQGLVSSPDGERRRRGTVSGQSALALGQKLGNQLLSEGARELFEEVAH